MRNFKQYIYETRLFKSESNNGKQQSALYGRSGNSTLHGVVRYLEDNLKI